VTGDFPGSVVDEAWIRSGGKCECTRTTHSHIGRCNKMLLKSARGDRNGFFGWEAHHISSTGGDTLSNCEMLCWNPCHKATL